MFTTFAHDPRYKDVIFVTTHPGAVATDMIANVGASHLAELTPEQSVVAQLKVCFCAKNLAELTFSRFSKVLSPRILESITTILETCFRGNQLPYVRGSE